MRLLAWRLWLAGLLLLGGLLLAPAVAEAAFDPFQAACERGGGPACSAPTGDPLTGPQGALSRVTTLLALVLGIVSVIFVIWGGIKYILANGDSSSISTAKSTIIYALIGLMVALLARPLINFVLSRI